MERFDGGCLCGQVRFVALGRPFRVGVCHCLDCRKHHGALFHASAVFAQDSVTIEGETREYAGRCFCPRCGSSVFGRSDDEVEVNLGALDASDQFTPTYELWAVRREKWLPKFPATRRYERDREGSARKEQGGGMISREQAAEIAKSDVLAHGLGIGVRAVLLPEELTGRGPVLYGVDLGDCWIAYIEQSGGPAQRSSTIVVIGRENGQVVYRGSANDEG